MATTVYPAQATIWLASLQATQMYASVHFELPSTADPFASECVSSSYVRSLLTWEFEDERTLWSVQGLEWLNLEDTTIIGVGATDAPFGGNLRLWFQLDDPVTISGRGSWSLPAHSLVVQI